MRLTLEVDDSPRQAPPRGTLQVEAGEPRAFTGWLELMTVLDEILSSGPEQGADQTRGKPE